MADLQYLVFVGGGLASAATIIWAMLSLRERRSGGSTTPSQLCRLGASRACHYRERMA